MKVEVGILIATAVSIAMALLQNIPQVLCDHPFFMKPRKFGI